MSDGKICICQKCNGEGYLMNRGQQVAAGIISLGIFPLLDAAMSDSVADSEFSRVCNVCKGRGTLSTKEPQ